MSKERMNQLRQEPLPESLSEFLVDKELDPFELRASQAADVMNLSFRDKRTLFGAFVYKRSGVFRARDLIGIASDQVVDMRDKVMVDQKYEEVWRRFSLLQRPNFLEVAQGKKAKKKHSQIGQEIGLTEHEVDEISIHLIGAEIIQPSPRGKMRSEKFNRFVMLVEKEDLSWKGDGPRKTEEELARELSTTISVIRRARVRIRQRSGEKILSPKFSKKPNYEKVKARRSMVKEGLDRGLTNRQISNEYEIPFELVRNDRAWFRDRNMVSKVIYSKDSNKEILRGILMKFKESNPPGTLVNLKEIQRSGELPVSYSELYVLYSELAMESDIPSVRKVKRRKSA